MDLRVEQETPALVVCDGQWGLGQVQAHRLLDLLFPKARALGVAVGAARDCGHIGRLGEYAERAASEGLLLHGDREQLRGLAAGRSTWRNRAQTEHQPVLRRQFRPMTPIRRSSPILERAWSRRGRSGDITSVRRRVPEGWLLDHKGQPTTDPGGALRAAAGHNPAAGRSSVVQGFRAGSDPRALGRRPFGRPVQRSRGPAGRREQCCVRGLRSGTFCGQGLGERSGQPLG